MTARPPSREELAGPGGGRHGRPRVWFAAIRRMDDPPGGRPFPGFFNFGPLALAGSGVARVAAWERQTPEPTPPAVGFRVRCGNGAALTVALAAVPPGLALATPFMAERARVDVSPVGKAARDFGEHDVDSALALVAMVCTDDG
jgi:hypothetical protein